jgi:uncharacterized Ntn-hydrolase superfamily protein
MTYSIIGRDPDSGEMGVATQSQAFAVGSSVSWALPGYGVIASQSMGEPMYGELGLEVLRSGLTASEAITALRSVDPHPERRQVGMADGNGGFDGYTGDACVGEAGQARGEHCIALANMMRSPDVWQAMVDAFEATDGWLAGRLMAALHAAEDAGGDRRGRRSAAIEVVCAQPSGRPWRDHIVDLRVDDDPQPVARLGRMVDYSFRYHQMVAAFELALDDEPQAAMESIGDLQVDPDEEPELALWEAIVLGSAERWDEAEQLGQRLWNVAPDLAETARHFGDVGLVDPALLERILGRDR